MPTLSLCLIARDEEQMLPGCLASVEGIADDVVLVDTGSRDRTKEIAFAAGARVFEVPWTDDFSAPRNEALRHARGDWVLQLDADERLAPGAGVALRRATRKAKFDVGLMPLHNASAIDAPPAEVLTGRARLGNAMSLPRLFRRSRRPEYRGAIHESVEEWWRAGQLKAAFLDAAIIHLGAVESLRDARGKNERNLALLRRRCEREPTDFVALGYLAGELFAIGDVDGASAAVETAWAMLPSQPPWRSIVRVAANRARIALARGDAERALETVEVAERRHGRTFDLAFYRAYAWDVSSYRDGDAASRADAAGRAASAYAEALALASAPAIEKLTRAGVPELRLRRGHALLVAARPDEAAREFGAVVAEDPASILGRLGQAEVLLVRGDAGGALRLLAPVLVAAARCPDAWLLASEAARRLGANADADVFLARTREQLAGGFAAPHRGARLGAS